MTVALSKSTGPIKAMPVATTRLIHWGWCWRNSTRWDAGVTTIRFMSRREHRHLLAMPDRQASVLVMLKLWDCGARKSLLKMPARLFRCTGGFKTRMVLRLTVIAIRETRSLLPNASAAKNTSRSARLRAESTIPAKGRCSAERGLKGSVPTG